MVLERCPIRQLPQRPITTEHERFRLTVVSIFAVDEPVDLVVEAAKNLPEVEFHILGDPQRAAPGLVAAAPKNVHFPGFLGGNEYWELLCGSNAVMTLTSEPMSLVSGGVESMALGRPTIVSRQQTLTDYFTKGTVFVEHSAASITAGIQTAQIQENRLTHEIRELAVEKQRRWLQEIQALRNTITAAARHPTPLLHQREQRH
ncbi:MAG: glycosyltransferase [Oscillochloris sp.]|nr:glycosyltransferase [Oscillochloris sp.]